MWGKASLAWWRATWGETANVESLFLADTYCIFVILRFNALDITQETLCKLFLLVCLTHMVSKSNNSNIKAVLVLKVSQFLPSGGK